MLVLFHIHLSPKFSIIINKWELTSRQKAGFLPLPIKNFTKNCFSKIEITGLSMTPMFACPGHFEKVFFYKSITGKHIPRWQDTVQGSLVYMYMYAYLHHPLLNHRFNCFSFQFSIIFLWFIICFF